MKNIIIVTILFSLVSFCSGSKSMSPDITGKYSNADEMLSFTLKENGACEYHESTFSEFLYEVKSCTYTINGNDVELKAELDYGNTKLNFSIVGAKTLKVVKSETLAGAEMIPIVGLELKALPTSK